jgi:regulator of sirC expression with transglutaminase-like and TPR domain
MARSKSIDGGACVKTERDRIVSTRSRRTFEQLVTLPEGAIPLAESALLVACEEYPQLEISPYLDQLDQIAGIAQRKLRRRDTPVRAVKTINAVLFETLGFRGNTEDYYDPRNSFLNEVLDRRMGIPITLSAVYLEIGRRLNFPIAGVGLPGHFVVRYADNREEFFLDPFNGGAILTYEDCRARIQAFYGDSLEFNERLLAPVTHRQILSRMLNNLKAIYLKAQAFNKALAIVDMMLLVEPDDLEQLRDRGLLRFQLRQFEGAARDLHGYVRNRPDAPDLELIQGHLKEIKRFQVLMN